MRIPLIGSLLTSMTVAAPERGATDDGLERLADAAEHMGPEGAKYAHEAIDNWPTAAEAEHRLPTRF